MKVWRVFTLLAAVAVFKEAIVRAADDEDEDRPGICEETEDCTAKGYDCIALQTTRADTDTVKQCLPKVDDTDVCSGQYPGMCPTFSSWVSPYNQISSLCTYKPAEDCSKDPTGSSVEGELICVGGAKDLDGNSIDVIYGCVDFDVSALEVLFGDDDADDLADTLDTAASAVSGCLNSGANSTSSLLCSGQGTCLPETTGSLNYACRCNVGYNGTYCEGIESNKCQLPGQCATGVCNLTTNECECAEGTTGNQCSECDPTSSAACNSQGTCGLEGTCECDDGWEGLQCTKEVDTDEDDDDSSTDGTAKVGDGSSSNSARSLGSGVTSTLVIAGMAIAAAAAM